MKRILITGGAGFVGSHLCKRLVKEGNHVVCLDNLYTGRIENIEEIIDSRNFEFINHDICHSFSCKVDEIYHLACPASPPHYQSDPIKTLKTSFIGSLNMLNIAKKLNAKILLASTSEIYGDPEVHPQSENYWGNVNPIGIRSCYDEGKRCAETLFSDYRRMYNIDSKIIRIFNTYGPNMDPNDGRVVSNFINQSIKNKNITIYGDGKQTRSFQYVSDLIEGIIRTMNTDSTVFGPFNIGNPHEFTIKELAEIIVNMTNSKSQIIYLDLPKDDPKKRKPEISKAFEYLNGWRPKIELKQGLIKTIEYFKSI